MSIVNLLLKQRVRFGVNASDEFLPFGAVELDASIEENHVSANTITQFPVETGVDISDHVRKQPDRVTIRGVVTDHPTTFGGAGRSGRSLDSYYDVLTMIDEAQVISIVTSLRQYANMVIESMEVPRNAALGSSVQMSLSFRELKTVEVAVAAGTSDKGTQNATQVS